MTSKLMKILKPKFETITWKPTSKLCWDVKLARLELTEKLPVKERYGRAGSSQAGQVRYGNWLYGLKETFFVPYAI